MKQGGAPDPGKYVRILYGARFRRQEDRDRVLELYKDVFHPEYPLRPVSGALQVGEDETRVGEFGVRRRSRVEGGDRNRFLLSSQRQVMELVTGCVQNSWPVILTGRQAFLAL